MFGTLLALLDLEIKEYRDFMKLKLVELFYLQYVV
jgi:hypothetical protein